MLCVREKICHTGRGKSRVTVVSTQHRVHSCSIIFYFFPHEKLYASRLSLPAFLVLLSPCSCKLNGFCARVTLCRSLDSIGGCEQWIGGGRERRAWEGKGDSPMKRLDGVRLKGGERNEGERELGGKSRERVWRGHRIPENSGLGIWCREVTEVTVN